MSEWITYNDILQGRVIVDEVTSWENKLEEAQELAKRMEAKEWRVGDEIRYIPDGYSPYWTVNHISEDGSLNLAPHAYKVGCKTISAEEAKRNYGFIPVYYPGDQEQGAQ